MLVVYCARNPPKKDCFSEDLSWSTYIVNSKQMTMNHQQSNWVTIWPTWIVNWTCSSHHFPFNNELFKTYPHFKLTHRLWNLIILGCTSLLRCPYVAGAFAVGRFSSSHVPTTGSHQATSASLHKLLRKERWRMRHHLSHLHEAAWAAEKRQGSMRKVVILSKVIFSTNMGDGISKDLEISWGYNPWGRGVTM